MLSYITAFMETLTIAHYPHYAFDDRNKMYLASDLPPTDSAPGWTSARKKPVRSPLQIGSVFYAIYFWVSFPMFFLMDEDPKDKPWTLGYTLVNVMAAGMICTILLDIWRLVVGPLGSAKGAYGLPWIA